MIAISERLKQVYGTPLLISIPINAVWDNEANAFDLVDADPGNAPIVDADPGNAHIQTNPD